MEYTNIEPRLSTYLHSKACRLGIPLAGNFELTARCNFDCRMCYVHLSAQEQKKRGPELTTDQWMTIAEEARSQGMLFLLLTGGEPLIRSDFRYLLKEWKKMGFLVSVNTNASLMDEDWLDFFRAEPPFRFNITLYGASNETYEGLCGLPAFDRVVSNIRGLKEAGIDVKLNVSLTPYNAGDMEKIYQIAHELATPMQLSTYMFPPIRKDQNLVGRNDRFTAQEAAAYGVAWDRLRFTPEEFRQRGEAMAKGLSLPREEACEGTPGEGIRCRAGRSSFWLNWQGHMTPCGMMNAPAFSVPEMGFTKAWEATRDAAAQIRLPGRCKSCSYRHACHACAAVCVTETGHFDVCPEYVCTMSRETVRLTLGDAATSDAM